MNVAVRDLIKEFKPTVVARAMGLPTSTVFRWMNQDRIPGKGAAYEWRRRQFEEAIRVLRRAPKKRRAA